MATDMISHQYFASPCLPRYKLPRPVLGLRIDVACGGDGGFLENKDGYIRDNF